MNNTKEKRANVLVIVSSLVLTVVLMTEVYLMVNYVAAFLIPIILLGIIALIAVFLLVNAVLTISTEREAQRQAQLENLYKSEKASYIMVKKKFQEIESKLATIQETSKIPSEEIINAQKGIAKVIINRSKENADAIINSNDQVLERLDEIDETQNTKFTGISKDQRLKLTEMSNQTEMRLQDMVVQLKDMELRLNQAIMQGSGGRAVSEEPFMDEDVFGLEEEPIIEENPVADPVTADDPNKAMSPDDIAALFASMSGESVVEEEEIIEPEVEELPPMPDLSDPNRALSPDEIAALIANL